MAILLLNYKETMPTISIHCVLRLGACIQDIEGVVENITNRVSDLKTLNTMIVTVSEGKFVCLLLFFKDIAILFQVFVILFSYFSSMGRVLCYYFGFKTTSYVLGE